MKSLILVLASMFVYSTSVDAMRLYNPATGKKASPAEEKKFAQQLALEKAQSIEKAK